MKGKKMKMKMGGFQRKAKAGCSCRRPSGFWRGCWVAGFAWGFSFGAVPADLPFYEAYRAGIALQPLETWETRSPSGPAWRVERGSLLIGAAAGWVYAAAGPVYESRIPASRALGLVQLRGDGWRLQTGLRGNLWTRSRYSLAGFAQLTYTEERFTGFRRIPETRVRPQTVQEVIPVEVTHTQYTWRRTVDTNEEVTFRYLPETMTLQEMELRERTEMETLSFSRVVPAAFHLETTQIQLGLIARAEIGPWLLYGGGALLPYESVRISGEASPFASATHRMDWLITGGAQYLLSSRITAELSFLWAGSDRCSLALGLGILF